MKKHYLYRFKTKEEFLKDYGENWRCPPNVAGFPYLMDFLFGQPFMDENCLLIGMINGKQRFQYLIDHDIWTIDDYMLTENRPIEPNYKPKRIERTL